MKSGVASMLFGVRALQLAGAFPGRVVVCALADEEGMMLGAKHFAASERAAEIDACIVCEPEGGELCVVARGAIRIDLGFHGVMAHGAMPQRGRNPVAAAGALLASLPEYQAGLRAAHPDHPYLGSVHVTPTVIAGGDPVQVNVIPARARVMLDVRTIPGVDHAALVREVGALAGAAGDPVGVAVALEVIDDRPAVEIDPEHPVVRALAAAHTEELGEPPALGGVPGATDGTILTRDAGIPTVVYGPGGKWIAHQADEFVAVEELGRYARIYARAAWAFLTGGNVAA
jgi:succinyl-diaminopimelate desuccinylase